jgi:hypothetical protein
MKGEGRYLMNSVIVVLSAFITLSRAAPVFSITDYGAKGDGSTVNTAPWFLSCPGKEHIR